MYRMTREKNTITSYIIFEMSHNLFTNSEMSPNYSWKGKTITQLMSSIQKNKNNTILTKINLDKSQP